jgi:putative hydrolase of the HAD superfamily
MVTVRVLARQRAPRTARSVCDAPGLGVRAVLLDLDDTLLVEKAANEDARLAVCAIASERYGVEVRSLCGAVKAHAGALWRASASSTIDYCRRIGLSSSEALWCRFLGHDRNTRRLHAWAPAYRTEAWHWALADLGVRDRRFAGMLARGFPDERRSRHVLLPHARETLLALRQRYKLVLLTNGASCLQREKLAASGIGDLLDHVVVSGDLGVGKPDTRIFLTALVEARVGPAEAVMVGDSAERDIEGARRTGIAAIWLRGDNDEAGEADATIAGLAELPDAINANEHRRSPRGNFSEWRR